MIHRGLLFWSVAAVATAVGLFTVKYKVQDLEERIDRTNRKIVESQQATHMLKIEWAHLNEAERVERLALKHLQLEQANIKQVTKLDSLKQPDSSPRREAPLPFPPRTGNDVPSSTLPGGARRSGGRQPLAGLRTPFQAFSRTLDAPSTGHNTRAGTNGSGWRRPDRRSLHRRNPLEK
jgi:cell division protein FtsL